MVEFGLTPQNLDFLRSSLLRFLSEISEYKIYIFGSRALGTYKKYSDIDLYIESTPALTPEIINQLSVFFEESDFPYKVDLVTKETLLPAYEVSLQNTKKLLLQKQIASRS